MKLNIENATNGEHKRIMKKILTVVLCLILISGTVFGFAGCREDDDTPPHNIVIEIYVHNGELVYRSDKEDEVTKKFSYTGKPLIFEVKYHAWTKSGKDYGYVDFKNESRIYRSVRYSHYYKIAWEDSPRYHYMDDGEYPTEPGNYKLAVAFNDHLDNNAKYRTKSARYHFDIKSPES